MREQLSERDLDDLSQEEGVKIVRPLRAKSVRSNPPESKPPAPPAVNHDYSGVVNAIASQTEALRQLSGPEELLKAVEALQETNARLMAMLAASRQTSQAGSFTMVVSRDNRGLIEAVTATPKGDS